MASMCQACGSISTLHGCTTCSATVCSSCLFGFGCKVCDGGKKFAD